MEISECPSVRRMFDERATVAVIDFLRDTKVSCMVSLAPSAEEEGGEVSEREEGGPAPLKMYPFPLSSFSFVLSLIFLRRIFWDGDRGALI